MPRAKQYRVWSDGCDRIMSASSRRVLVKRIRESICWEDYQTVNDDEYLETFWEDVSWVRIDKNGDDIEGTEDEETFAVDPPEPPCRRAEHRWREESTQCHGGGVVIQYRCRHCGLVREYDSWAQRRDTGEQGLRSVTYDMTEYEGP